MLILCYSYSNQTVSFSAQSNSSLRCVATPLKLSTTSPHDPTHSIEVSAFHVDDTPNGLSSIRFISCISFSTELRKLRAKHFSKQNHSLPTRSHKFHLGDFVKLIIESSSSSS